jgi:NAD(P)-dependent dehydrogenase (short-subunit alcohol dehydrogenase family)
MKEADTTPKLCLITGAGGDLGQAMVLAFLAKDYAVAATDLQIESLTQLSTRGAVGFALDVTDAVQTSRVIHEILARFGRIDVLINCAGLAGAALPLDGMDPADFRAVVDVNLMGSFHTMRAVLPGMRSRGSGTIINIGSVSSVIGGRGLSAYAASKHAVLGMTRSAAQDLAGTGVRVLCVGPGPLEGKMMSGIDQDRGDGRPGGAKDAILDRVPSRRYGRMDEIAAFAVFLASESASFINGTFLPIDGGRLSS